MMKSNGWKAVCAAFLLCVTTAIVSPAQVTFTTLVNFDGSNGAGPQTALTQGVNGNFYGTAGGGTSGGGTVFELTPAGTLTTLHNFCSKEGCIDGESPASSLVQADNGDIYGVTLFGGSDYRDCPNTRCGTLFKINQSGMLTRFYSFCSLPDCADGAFPMGGLVQGNNGDLYGTTTDGGAHGGGTVFEITLTGSLTPLYNFCSQPGCADGSYVVGPLVQAFNKNFYGATFSGGFQCNPPYGCGTVFEMTPQGKLTTLYTFHGSDGGNPTGLIQASNGEFYGVTSYGGTSSNCPSGETEGCGTFFRISSGGELTTLHDFCSLNSCADGLTPTGPLVQATDGKLYGTTSAGGAYGLGTIYEIAPTGVLTTVYSFCAQPPACPDGASPYGGVLQSTNGVFYGTTNSGGTGNNEGTVFSLATGLGPFVSFVRNPAKVGEKFGILGYGLTGTTSVSLNGTPASFKVQSDTLLIATVPAGASTGYVTVTTPSGVLTSNVPFRVIP
jgi:uncharacterized repeat protein (TIGR03803 family)